MKGYTSFDIEIYNELLPDEDLKSVIPSIGAQSIDEENVKFYYDIPYMSKETAVRLIEDLVKQMNDGYPIFGWNTTSFDLQIMAHYTGMYEECGELALNSVDGMLLVTFNKGYFLALDTALKGAGLETKIHSVTLNNGLEFSEMNGSKAPEMWKAGEIEAVKQYLFGDIVQPHKLAKAIQANNGIRWTSKTGNPMFLKTELKLVRDCFSIPIPDTSWMTTPAKPRSAFISWIPETIREKYGILKKSA